MAVKMEREREGGREGGGRVAVSSSSSCNNNNCTYIMPYSYNSMNVV